MTESSIIQGTSEYLALVFERYSGWIFRGQTLTSRYLEPGLDRALADDSLGKSRLRVAQALLADFKRLGRVHLNFPPANEWEWIAIGQHHGLLTPLLDWTTNPLVALFFAVDEDTKESEDSAVWCYEKTNVIDPNSIPQPMVYANWAQHLAVPGPLSIEEVAIYFPVHISPRVTAQSGCFTVHPPPKSRGVYSWPGQLARIAISSQARLSIRGELETIGMHRAALFPGLDGLASYANRLGPKAVRRDSDALYARAKEMIANIKDEQPNHGLQRNVSKLPSAEP